MEGFKICMNLGSDTRVGIQAIDFCRAMDLPETNYMSIYGIRHVSVTDETFIREFFPPNAREYSLAIRVDQLLPGELVYHDGHFTIGEISEERAKALFIQAKQGSPSPSKENKPVSYRVRIDLHQFDDLNGFAAIDKRRAMGLPDFAKLAQPRHFTVLSADVTEGFARAWFGGDVEDSAEIELDWLVPGELVDDPPIGSGQVDLSPAMTAERIKDLYLRARFAQLQKDLERAEKLLAEASAVMNEKGE